MKKKSTKSRFFLGSFSPPVKVRVGIFCWVGCLSWKITVDNFLTIIKLKEDHRKLGALVMKRMNIFKNVTRRLLMSRIHFPRSAWMCKMRRKIHAHRNAWWVKYKFSARIREKFICLISWNDYKDQKTKYLHPHTYIGRC